MTGLIFIIYFVFAWYNWQNIIGIPKVCNKCNLLLCRLIIYTAISPKQGARVNKVELKPEHVTWQFVPLEEE